MPLLSFVTTPSFLYLAIMELVPIVITVLEIVSVFAVVTLTVSYTIFKIRQKSKPAVASNISESQDMKPHFVGRGLKRLTQMTREILPPIRKEEVRKSRPVEKPVEKRPIQKERQTERKSAIGVPRVEVVNNLSSQPPKPENNFERQKPVNKNDLNSLGEDILDKYVDEDNQNLFTLKTNKKEENKK